MSHAGAHPLPRGRGSDQSRAQRALRQPAVVIRPLAAIFAALALAPAGCNRVHKVTAKETVEEAPGTTGTAMVIDVGDPKRERQLVSGFYAIEANSWRWTAKDFTVSLRPPAGSGGPGGTHVLRAFIS